MRCGIIHKTWLSQRLDWVVGFFISIWSIRCGGLFGSYDLYTIVWFALDNLIRLSDSVHLITRFVRFIQFARFIRSFGSPTDSFGSFVRMRMRNPMCVYVCAGISVDAITIYIDKQSYLLCFLCSILP